MRWVCTTLGLAKVYLVLGGHDGSTAPGVRELGSSETRSEERTKPGSCLWALVNDEIWVDVVAS